MKYNLPNVLEMHDNENHEEISNQNFEFDNTNKGG